ncbi:peptide deformylase [Candidatus Wolfebacteria bacterium]|nr:peptide deformylase [Candidatus Wolfebacteria bacterium]
MENQKILTIKNKSEEKFLRKRAADFDFSKFTKKEIRELVDKMKKIMKDANGIGLSANQIGLDIQMFVAGMPQSASQRNGSPKFYAIFNPKLTKQSSVKSPMEEGCLSVPELYGDVERPEKTTLTGFDKNQKPIKIKAVGLLARIFQHEVDHLNGVLFVDKAKDVRKHTAGEELGKI